MASQADGLGIEHSFGSRGWKTIITGASNGSSAGYGTGSGTGGDIGAASAAVESAAEAEENDEEEDCEEALNELGEAEAETIFAEFGDEGNRDGLPVSPLMCTCVTTGVNTDAVGSNDAEGNLAQVTGDLRASLQGAGDYSVSIESLPIPGGGGCLGEVFN